MGRVLAEGFVLHKSNMAVRLASAAVLLPIFYYITKSGGVIYDSLLLLGVLWSGYEWLAMVNPGGQKLVWVAVLFTHALTWGLAVQESPAVALAVCLSISLVMMAAFRVLKIPKPVLLSMGVSYLGAAMLGLVALRGLPDVGFSLMVLLCGATWLTDAGAYFFGKFLRGARLAPDISPSKTWTGVFGGIATAILGAGIAILLYHPQKPAVVIGVAVFLSLASQCGDLFESWVKRQAKVKNSSDLIPGHGGLLDRIDGLIMATLMFWAMLWATITICRGGLNLKHEPSTASLCP